MRIGLQALSASAVLLLGVQAPPKLETSPSAQPCPGGIYREAEDRFEGGKTAFFATTGGLVRSGPIGKPALSFTWDSTAADVVTMSFRQALPTSRYRKCSATAMLADGAKVPVTVLDVDGKDWSDHVQETVRISLLRAGLDALIAAQRVEYRICAFEFEMSPIELCGLRLVARAAVSSVPKITARKKR